MSIPVTEHSSLTRQARQSTKQTHSPRVPAHAFGKSRQREDKVRSQRHEQQWKSSGPFPAFLRRNEGIKTLQKKADPVRLTANGQFERW
jgi:hypothetical protein